MIQSTLRFGMAAAVFAASLLGSVYPASGADPKRPTISAAPAVVVVQPGKIGSTTLVYDAGKNHPYVEVWYSVNGSDLKKLLEDDGDGKGTRKVSVTGSVAGTKYRYVLTDFGKVLASVNVIAKSVNPTPGNPAPNPTPGNPTPGNPTPGNPTPGNPTPGNPTPNPTPSSSRTHQMRDAINAFRAQNGLPALTFSNKLISVAGDYATVMAKMDKMGHSVDGTTVGQRLDAGGYKYSRFFENVAWNMGQADPGAEAVKSWRESTSGHREAMLSRDVTELGIGIATSSTGKTYFCLVLGKPR